jgi:hypothetical protein
MSTPLSDPRGVEPAPRTHTIPRPGDLLGVAQETAREMLEAEQALNLVQARFEHTEDPEAKGELAAEALDHVEHQLALTRERRSQLDGVEGKLWARRNRLERFLIQTRGSSWWRARHNLRQPEAAGRSPSHGNALRS